jgi:hypothetical protein
MLARSGRRKDTAGIAAGDKRGVFGVSRHLTPRKLGQPRTSSGEGLSAPLSWSDIRSEDRSLPSHLAFFWEHEGVGPCCARKWFGGSMRGSLTDVGSSPGVLWDFVGPGDFG